MILGAHVSTSGGIDKAPLEASKLGINAIAIFAKNQRQWVGKPLVPEIIINWHKEVKSRGITHKISHDSYLINLCSPVKENLDKSIDSLTDELERAETLGLTHVVTHPGSHLNEGEEVGLKVIADSLNEIHKRLPGYKSKITLEITAGQGTNLGYSFEQINDIIERTNEQNRLAVCFDTCHAFAAGYDILSDEGYNKTWELFDKIIGLDLLEVFHLNDSKHEMGSRKDRHEKIGMGCLGLEPFRKLLNDPRFADIPGILETPDSEGGYAEDLKELGKLISTTHTKPAAI